jgi:RNA polymerase sigma factor (sigma-70 family)
MHALRRHPTAESPPAEAVPRLDAARVVVEAHATKLFRFVRCLGASREVADDLTQEAFVVAWQKGKQALPAAALAAFLRRTARYLWLDHRRREQRERRGEAAIAAATLQVWERELPDDGEQLVAATRACVQRLRGRAARAVELAYGRGAGRERIAAELGLQPNGVKTLLARTRRWLEDCIRRTTS